LNSSVERELVQRAQTGDSRAFAELVETHLNFAYHVALRTLNNTQDAEDVVQEAFIKAWKALRGFRAEASFRTWLYRIVMNLCYSQLPKLRREIRSLDEDNGKLNLVELKTEFNPAAFLEGKEFIETVQSQIEVLPKKYQILLLLRHQQGCSYAEIAEIMDLPLGTVKTGIFRARERLREAVSIREEERVSP